MPRPNPSLPDDKPMSPKSVRQIDPNKLAGRARALYVQLQHLQRRITEVGQTDTNEYYVIVHTAHRDRGLPPTTLINSSLEEALRDAWTLEHLHDGLKVNNAKLP